MRPPSDAPLQWSRDRTQAHFGPLAVWVGNDGPASNAWTRETLGWTPEQPGIVADIEQPDYQG